MKKPIKNLENYLILMFFLLSLLTSAGTGFAESPKVSIATLKFGTVNWELLTMKRLGLDQKNGFNLEIKPLAGKSAVVIAFQGKEVDMMVTDWVWVSNQRAKGAKYTSIPYSKTVGALIVQKDSPIKSLGDLAGRKLGIVGGAIDKNWLLLQAVSLQKLGYNLKDKVDASFGSPVLLSKKFEQGELDAVFTFWHFAAKLNAKGYPTLLDAESLMKDMGVTEAAPMLGYTFRDELAQNKKDLIAGFVKAVYETKKVLASDDSAWTAIRKKMNAKSDAAYHLLVEKWRTGIPRRWGDKELNDAAKLLAVLHKMGGAKLSKSDQVSAGTFWSEFSL